MATRSNISSKRRRKLRDAALEKQGGLCKYCFNLVSPQWLTLDHGESANERRKKGISVNSGNIMVASCYGCNMSKGSLHLVDFVALIASEREPTCERIKKTWQRRHRNLRLLDAARQIAS